MHYFPSRSSKRSHLNHKNSEKRAKFSDKWSPGGAPPPGPPLASALSMNLSLSTYVYHFNRMTARIIFKLSNHLTRSWSFVGRMHSTLFIILQRLVQYLFLQFLPFPLCKSQISYGAIFTDGSLQAGCNFKLSENQICSLVPRVCSLLHTSHLNS